uniref:Uncharacterized protein n=1 Tax=Anguilla anguilla TaxID=7936 RepID=A0A0E9XHU2_ANGAN
MFVSRELHNLKHYCFLFKTIHLAYCFRAYLYHR